jgi:hypothetical protein
MKTRRDSVGNKDQEMKDNADDGRVMDVSCVPCGKCRLCGVAIDGAELCWLIG